MSETNIDLQKIHDLAEKGLWQDVLAYLQAFSGNLDTNLATIKSRALLKTEQFEEAYYLLSDLIVAHPKNVPLVTLYYEAVAMLKGQLKAAFSLRDHIVANKLDSEFLLAKCADALREQSKFKDAISINKLRLVIRPPIQKIAIAIQTFNKADTLKGLLDSLLKCDDSEFFSPVILQDSWKKSKKPEVFKEGFDNVQNLIEQYFPLLVDKFGSIELLVNEQNLGTAPSCVKLLNHVSKKHTSFIFFEDDCILFKDTLVWAKYAIENLIDPYDAHFATCESVFFDFGKKQAPTDEQVTKLKAIGEHLNSHYCSLNFVPSTNFLTKSEIWHHYSDLRCLPRGPESLNAFYKETSGKCIFPFVPRTVDIGMEHEMGYSTTNLGKGNVKEIKNSFINSGLFPTPLDFSEYSGDKDLVYSASSNIHPDHIDKLLKITNE
jgi:hypothetical protein